MTDQTCPACDKPTDELIAGVCPRCKENMKAAHKGKMEVKWSRSDLEIPKAHYEQSVSFDETETAFEPTIERDDEKALEVARRFKIGLNYCLRYSGNIQMALHCLALALGFRDLTTNGKGQVLQTDEEIGGLFSVEKASVGKCKLDLQARMGIEPMGGQRSKAARAKMRVSRKKQLKKD